MNDETEENKDEELNNWNSWTEEIVLEVDEELMGPDAEQEECPGRGHRRATLEATKAEREQHRLTHLPYRSWCDVCVRARGIATGHRARRRPDER